MQIAIVHDSRTGRTSAAAQAMAETFEANGHTCRVLPIVAADPVELLDADLVCAGAWTHGLMVMFQHPAREWVEFVERFGNLGGKKVVIFCTYRVAAGRMLERMARPFLRRGADVVARFAFRGPTPDASFARFAASL